MLCAGNGMTNDLEFRSLRVLLVGGKPNVVRVLRTVLGLAGVNAIVIATDSTEAMRHLRLSLFDAVFCDETAEPIDRMPFAVAARRAPDVLNHMVPIFLTCSGPRRTEVEAARNEGVTDVLARPISAATVIRKLTAALIYPRSFIAAPGFFGPDRRGKRHESFSGDDRRARKARKVKVAKPDGLTYL